MLTQEYIPGVGYVTQDATFQRYGDPSGSAAGWWSLMQSPLYKDVLNAPDLQSAIGAIGRSPYATDPAYGAKVGRMTPSTPAQQSFYEARVGDLLAAGASPTMAHLGARQSALETGWGRSAPSNNYFGIKAPTGSQNAMMLAQAGRPDIEQGLYAEIPSMGAQQPQQQAPGMAMPPQQAQQAPGFMDKLNMAMQNPLFLTGASILANNRGNYGAAAPAIGAGLMGGQTLSAAMQEDQLNAQMKRMQMARAQRQMALEEQRTGYVDQWLSTQDPERQQLARMLGPDKFVELMLQQYGSGTPEQIGVKPEYELDPVTGKWHKIRYGSRGTVLQEEMTRTPGIYEYRDPEMIRKQAEARVTGAEQAKNEVAFGERYSSSIGEFNQSMATLERMATMPGMSKAVGWQANFPTAKGTEAKDYELKLGQLKGENFLANVKTMAGLGALSNAEGDAIRAAQSDIDVGQTEEGHKASMAILYANLSRGSERLKTRKLLGPGQDAPAATPDEVNAAYKKLFSGQQQQQSAIKPGHIENGYRYKGGDPGKRESWEQI